MSQRKIEDTFKNLSNVYGTADDILAKGYDRDGIDYDEHYRLQIIHRRLATKCG